MTISNSLILLYKIAALRLLPWMACMQKKQKHFSAKMTVIYELIRGSLGSSPVFYPSIFLFYASLAIDGHPCPYSN